MSPKSFGKPSGKGPLTPANVAELTQNGYTVVRGVWSPERCAETVRFFKEDWMQAASPSGKKLVMLHNIVSYPSVGHAKMTWQVREDPAVCRLFSELWGVEPGETVSSYDRMAYYAGGDKSPATRPWPHVDQGKTWPRNSLQCIQGFMNFVRVPVGGATLNLVPGSHLHHGDILDEIERRKGDEKAAKPDFVPLDDDTMAWTRDKLGLGAPVAVDGLEPGDFVLWDSRTIHWGGKASHPDPQTGLYPERMVIYVCHVPRAWCSSEILDARRRALLACKTTSHWPHKVTIFSDKPRHYGREKELLGGLTFPTACPGIMACLPETENGARMCGFDSLEQMKAFL